MNIKRPDACTTAHQTTKESPRTSRDMNINIMQSKESTLFHYIC